MRLDSRFLVMALLLSLAATGCGRLRSRAAFKDGNKHYREENFKRAISDYERALAVNPGLLEARFYLASSHQAMFRPGKDDPENRQHLEVAIEEYRKAVEQNDQSSENLKKVRQNALGALTGIYAEDPYKDYEKARSYAEELIKDNPNDARNLYALANLYEKFSKIDEAEATYRKVAELNPNDIKACGALAGFFNKPLWEGRSKFDEAIETLTRCASLAPDDPAGYQKVATFYWDKAYRDPLLDDKQKSEYAEKGLEAVNKALELNSVYFEAIIFKGLLYRVKASVAKTPRERLMFLEEAQALQKRGLDLKRVQQELEKDASPSPSPGA